jgi:hypothetical protein
MAPSSTPTYELLTEYLYIGVGDCKEMSAGSGLYDRGVSNVFAPDALSKKKCLDFCKLYDTSFLVGFTLSFDDNLCSCEYIDGMTPTAHTNILDINPGATGLVHEANGNDNRDCYGRKAAWKELQDFEYSFMANTDCLSSNGNYFGSIWHTNVTNFDDCVDFCNYHDTTALVGINLNNFTTTIGCVCWYTSGNLPPHNPSNSFQGDGGTGFIDWRSFYPQLYILQPSNFCYARNDTWQVLSYSTDYAFVGNGDCVTATLEEFSYGLKYVDSLDDCVYHCNQFYTGYLVGFNLNYIDTLIACLCEYTDNKIPAGHEITYTGGSGVGEVEFITNEASYKNCYKRL